MTLDNPNLITVGLKEGTERKGKRKSRDGPLRNISDLPLMINFSVCRRQIWYRNVLSRCYPTPVVLTFGGQALQRRDNLVRGKFATSTTSAPCSIYTGIRRPCLLPILEAIITLTEGKCDNLC